jgi:hypothetical protein
MTPERQATIAGVTVKEFYWAGDMVVYVNNQHVEDTFDHACAELRVLEDARAEGRAP